jgi:integrase
MDSRQTFSGYAEYVINTKVRVGILKPKTEHHYRKLLVRVNEAIGHMKLKDIRPQHINQLYEQLSQNGMRRNGEKATAKVDLKALLEEKGMSQMDIPRCESVTIHYNTVIRAFNGKRVDSQSAMDVAKALEVHPNKLFDFHTDETPLANRTIRDYHQFVSTVLADAEKEMLIPYNPASKARPPKIESTKPNYYQSDDIVQILAALGKEKIKWRTMFHLFLVTGARLGEIIGLKWDRVMWNSKQIQIDRALYYIPDRGLYEDTPKTKNSVRAINLPNEMITLLKEYRIWQLEQMQLLGNRWHNSGYVFANEEGGGLNPGTVDGWLRRFRKKHNLPHLNTHAFRHTQASILLFNGVDAVSVSRRLGHAKVSTTTDIYSHIMDEAEAKAKRRVC